MPHHDDTRLDRAVLHDLIVQLDQLAAWLADLEQDQQSRIAALHPRFRDSGRNLLHYVALRRHDIRPLQQQLANLGLSSLGRSEAHVAASLRSLLTVLRRLAGVRSTPFSVPLPVDRAEGQVRLIRHTDALLGTPPAHRSVRIMVTMPSEAADDYTLVREMMQRGMNLMRINTAHDDEAAWGRMVAHLERARRELGLPCQIFMDLAGPKLRTGPLAPGPQVVRWRPQRDPVGQQLEPARILLYPASDSAPPANGAVPLPIEDGAWVTALTTGDSLTLRDTRKRSRLLTVIGGEGRRKIAVCERSAFVVPGTAIQHRGDPTRATRIAPLPPQEEPLLLHHGDRLTLTRAQTPGHPPLLDDNGNVVAPAAIPCTLPQVFDAARKGERVWFDDGKIGGVIAHVAFDAIEVEITDAPPDGAKLRPEKGINLPDTLLPAGAITPRDREVIPFVARHADLVGLSFVQTAQEIREVRRLFQEQGRTEMGLLLKIETRKAFERLPDLLLAAMEGPFAGVMIARGDLALECGFERMAEIQEEILWLCEAAHLPVIWATQVLENLAKKGRASRAEITDAAQSVRAEGVMLNKGPHILIAITMLDSILRRMAAHQSKKSSLLRQLHGWPDGETALLGM